MDFLNDPRRAQIEPMDDFLRTWARWGKFRPIRYTSLTYRVMCWLRDHSKEVQQIREGIVTGERIRYYERDEDCEKIALKVEYYLRKMFEDGKVAEVERLRFYYLKCPPEMPIKRIAKRLGCSKKKIDETIKADLYLMSMYWKD